MKICGIVAEYNPFHNGHEYQVKEIKKKTDTDIIIAIMSGNFVQRGAPAIFDKWKRTQMALENGVDIVIELPTCFSTSSAEYFASGAISILNSLNSVDYVSFGVKNDEIKILKSIADLLIEEPQSYKEDLQRELKSGISFPVARSKCIRNYFKDKFAPNIIEDILLDPNNILAIEYLKALKTLNSPIEPFLVKRVGTDYNSLDVNDCFCSSTAIREILKKEDIEKLKTVMPDSSYKILEQEIQAGKLPMELSNYEKEILYNLRKVDSYYLSQLPDVNEGLEHLIIKSLSTSFDLDSLIDSIKSKRYTRTRIQRILIHSMLDIKEHYLKKYKFTPQYARVLGFSKEGKKALSYISKNSKIPIVTSLNTFLKTATEEQKDMIQLDISATNLYTLGYNIPKHRKLNLDFTEKIVES